MLRTMDFKWIRNAVLIIAVITLVFIYGLWSDLMNPAYRGATIQGIASVVSALITIFLLGLTYRSTQRAEQAESEAREVIENAQKQATAMETLAEATNKQSQILQEALKPNVILQFSAGQLLAHDHSHSTPTLVGVEMINLSDGLIYVEHAHFWKDQERTVPTAPTDNKRIILPGATALIPLIRKKNTSMEEINALVAQYPLGAAWHVHFGITFTFEKTGPVRHRLGGTLRSMQGNDPTLRFYTLTLQAGGTADSITKYRLHPVGLNFSCEQVIE